MSDDPIVSALGRVALFESLAAEALRRLASAFRRRKVGRREVIFAAGDLAGTLYVVERGGVRLLRDSEPEGACVVSRLRAGDVFGELGLFEGGRRAVTARAGDEGAVVLESPKDELDRFLADHPAVALKLYLAAAQGHSKNVERSLALAGRRAVRYTVHKRAELESDGDRVEVTVVDVSELGARLRGVPEGWTPDSRVACRLVHGSQSFPIEGRIAWNRAGLAGIEFAHRAPELLESFQRSAR